MRRTQAVAIVCILDLNISVMFAERPGMVHNHLLMEAQGVPT